MTHSRKRDRVRAGGGLPTRAAAALALGALGLIWVRRRYVVVVVEGPSMVPAYDHGDRLLARRLSDAHGVRRGAVVVADVDGRRVVKRVTALAGDRPEGSDEPVPADRLWLVGDHPGSIDSRRYGPVPVSGLVARVLVRLSRGQRQN